MIGLLGGSFNPPHEGHLHVARQAIAHLNLDEVWWLVSPQNPLKSTKETAPFAQRLQACIALTRHDPQIKVTNLEQVMGFGYSYQTIDFILKAVPQSQFIWLMGADNLNHFHKWRRWNHILSCIPLAILDRGGYSIKRLGGILTIRYKQHRRAPRWFAKQALIKSPSWSFIPIPKNSTSSTALRRTHASSRENNSA